MIPPTVELELDKPRKWRFSANAIIAFYRALGKDAFKRLEVFRPPEGVSDDERLEHSMETMPESLTVFIGLLWCGLLGEDSSLTLAAVGEMVGPTSMAELLPKLLEAANASMSGNPISAPSPENETVPTEADSAPGPIAASTSA